MISGCQTDQTSADANPPSDGAYGALRNAINTILAEYYGKISNKEPMQNARKILAKQGFKLFFFGRRPC